MTKRDEALSNAIRYQEDPVSRNYYRAFEVWKDGDLRRAYRLLTDYRDARPGDEDAIGAYFLLMSQLGLSSDITSIVKEIVDNGQLTMSIANQALQAVRTLEDADFMRLLAQESIERFGDDDASLLYQAHRQLLWARDIDGASLIMPRILNSELLVDTQKIAQLRQLCAEQRNDEAARFFAKMLEDYPDDVSIKWLGSKIIGDDEAAERLFLELDEQGDMDTLRDYLNYPQFDPKPFPNLMKELAGQSSWPLKSIRSSRLPGTGSFGSGWASQWII